MSTANDPHERLNQLDGLRGLAALSVFLLHTVEIAGWQPDARNAAFWQVLRPLWDGSAAVFLFFALSGFVLTLPYVGPSARKIDALPFIIRRVTRLYPAYWVAILLAILLRFCVFSPQGLHDLSPWANSLWHLPVSPLSLVRHFALIAPNLRTDELDPVIWSLVAEMKVSLIFPAVLLLMQKTRKLWHAVLVVGLFLACYYGLLMFGHLIVFLFGAYLAKYRTGIVGVLSSSAWLRAGLALCAYVLYGASSLLPFLKDPTLELAINLGACIWISLFLCAGPLSNFGRWRLVGFLGDVSYSFYLTHLPILLTVTSLLYPRTGSLLLCFAVTLACSLAVSYAIYRLVEIPTHNWGRRKGKAIANRIAARKAARQTTSP